MLTEIISPKNIVFSQDVDFIILPGEDGDFGVLNGHTPVVSNLRIGLLYIYEKNKLIKTYLLENGVCEVTMDKCIILTERAEDTEEIDIKKFSTTTENDAPNFISKLKKEALENRHYR